MVSWKALYDRGVRAVCGGFEVPDSADGEALERELRAEVAIRAVAMVKPPLRCDIPRHGACDACAEELPPYRGGWCPLCTAGRRRAIRLRDAQPTLDMGAWR